jgi:hypothetical protein
MGFVGDGVHDHVDTMAGRKRQAGTAAAALSRPAVPAMFWRWQAFAGTTHVFFRWRNLTPDGF